MAEEDPNARKRAQLSAAKQALLEKRVRRALVGAQPGQSEQDDRLPQIPPVPRMPGLSGSEGGELPLSFGQQRLWFLDQLEPGSPFYNISSSWRLAGALDLTTLRRCIDAIIQRHEVLRTTFASAGGQPVQVIAPALVAPIELLDLGAIAAEREATALELIRVHTRLPFDLASGPLVRAVLLRLGADDHVLHVEMHHIISDSWSFAIFARELISLYDAFSAGKPAPLPALPVQYADYAAWQRAWLQGPGAGETRRQGDKETRSIGSQHPTPNTQHPSPIQRQLAYWKERLGGDLPALELPTDRPRPPVQSFQGAWHSFMLPRPLLDALTALSRRADATLFMTLLAAFQTLLHRYSGQDDIIVGTAIANRNHRQIEGLIGFFVNTLALRAAVLGKSTFRALLEQVREVTIGAYAHQDVPFEKLVEELQPQRDMSRSPLFQVMFGLQNIPVAPLSLVGVTLSDFHADTGTTTFDLAFNLMERPEGLSGWFSYNSELFDPPTMARMAGHFAVLLEGIVAARDRRLADLPLLTTAEREQLLTTWNATATAFPHERCIHELFTAQAARTPDAVALVFDRPTTSDQRPTTSASPLHPFTQQLTYRELDRRANQLAHYLRSLGVGPETRVALAAERSPQLIVGLLGILKAGAAYLPLDLAYPTARLAFMLDDAQAPVLLTQRHLEDNLPAYRAMCVYLDDPDLAAQPTHSPPTTASPDNLAYLTYTSGSTGLPKGVAIPHRGVVRLVQATDYVSLSDDETFVQLAPIAFDASTFEVWGSLLNGARLVVLPAGLPALAELGAALLRQQVSTLWLTASLFQQLVETQLASLRGVRQLLAGGDVLSLPHVRRVLRELPGCRLINGYGPTENTTFTCCATLRADTLFGASVPIGRPIANTTVYLLDQALQPVPLGVAGELYTGGAGLARGYLNRPELTAERFLPNPFARVLGDGCWVLEDATPDTRHPTPITRLYKTGDLARYRPDGQIEFLGRVDAQVKLRGYRIELGEIETLLAQHPAVREAVVTLREDAPGGHGLVAYVVPKIEDRGLKIEDSGSDAPEPLSSILYPLSSELRGFLQTKLPDYMLPAVFVLLDALPMTPSGKVDRRALPAPEAHPEPERPFVAPRTPLEAALAETWAAVLGRERVGVHDNFFELGGHSLLATQLVSRVSETLQIDLPLRALFEAPTIAELVERVEAALGAAMPVAPPITPVARTTELPLSFAQQRMWFLNQLEPDQSIYKIPAAVRLAGSLDVTALAHGLDALVARHEPLRTTFKSADGRPVQVIAPALAVPLPLLDLRALPATAREAAAGRLATVETERPFDLARGPLVRAVLLRLGADDHILVLTMHHIVADGWSMGVLVRELTALYTAWVRGQNAALPPLPVQYADFAVWQRAWLQGSGRQGDKETRRQGDKETGVGRQGATARLPPPAGGGTEGAAASLPPPAGGGTEGGRSQESDVDERITQNSKLKTQNSPLEAQLAYWRRQLADLPALELPTDHPRPVAPTYRGATEAFLIDQRLAGALTALSQRVGVTLFMTVLTAFDVLLARYSRQDDIAVGTPIANRRWTAIEALIGFFVNTLVLRADLAGNPTVRELLSRVREICLGAYAHQDLPFEKLVEALPLQRDQHRQPLFQVFFALQKTALQDATFAGLTLRPLVVASETATFELALNLEERPDGIGAAFEFNTDLFDRTTIARMAGHFQTVLAGIAAGADQRLADLQLLAEAERDELLASWNSTAATYPIACLHELFAAQAARTPDAVAIVFDRPLQRQGDKETRRQGDKETRSQESGVRSQESEFLAPNPQSPIPNPQSAALSPEQLTDHRLPLHPFTPSPLHPFTPQHLTYCELNARANQLARYLQARGVGPEVLVGLCLERSLELVIGLLGILKAGAAYLPLDPSYPPERLAFMLEDAQVATLITTTDQRRPTNDDRPTTNDDQRSTPTKQRTGTIYRTPTTTTTADDRSTTDQRPTTNDGPFTPSPLHPFTPSQLVVDLRADWHAIAAEPPDNPACRARPENLAYAIYTSGSTGRPKGTLVSHANVARLFAATRDQLGFDARDVWTLFHSFAFDFSVWELWGALAHGGRLVVVSYWASRSPEAFRELLRAEHVTVLNQTPSAFRQLAQADADAASTQGSALRLVVFGGEALAPRDLAPWMARHGDQRPRLVNMYGITETTVHVTYRPLAKDDPGRAAASPIGRPLADLQVYVLDEQLRPQPIGVPGELYVGGAGLARGYLNRPELTAERFIPNPFLKIEDRRLKIEDSGLAAHESLSSIFYPLSSESDRLYKTGDLARYRADGEIEYLGRIDQQVKLRGFRIELGEIEAVLRQHPSVREAVVLAREDIPGEKRLVAYVVPTNDQRPTTNDQRASTSVSSSVLSPQSSVLRTFLAERLPDYMLPAAFVTLDALPLTPSGKLDRRALPAPDRARSRLAQPFVAPSTPVEEKLAAIWRELLDVDQVGVYDNFFELGGHSLLMTQLASRIRSTFEVNLPLRVLFDARTVVAMTVAIANMQVEQEDTGAIEQILQELDQLSADEIAALLSAESL